LAARHAARRLERVPMSEHSREKNEPPTQRKLEEAWKRGQFARSTELQTAVGLGAGFLAVMFSGRETWRILGLALTSSLGHLHETPLTSTATQDYVATGAWTGGRCVCAVLAAAGSDPFRNGRVQVRIPP